MSGIIVRIFDKVKEETREFYVDRIGEAFQYLRMDLPVEIRYSSCSLASGVRIFSRDTLLSMDLEPIDDYDWAFVFLNGPSKIIKSDSIWQISQVVSKEK